MTEVLRTVVVIQTLINALLVVALVIVSNRLARHQKALKWFANHVRVEAKAQREPMPEDLVALIDKIKDTPDET